MHTVQVPRSLGEFVRLAATMTHEEIYNTVEFGVSNALLGEIYTHAQPESAEPLRSALITLGEKFGVQSLVDY